MDYKKSLTFKFKSVITSSLGSAIIIDSFGAEYDLDNSADLLKLDYFKCLEKKCPLLLKEMNKLLTGRQAKKNEIGDDGPSLDVVKWMLKALEIGMDCTSIAPEKRPSMNEVVRALQSLQTSSS
ncbi:leucine-rich repeat protein kinase family protein [Striga asiatica]|uniref:Leucine-rich repeat protein kinase family protein n=1 Tax=Striga asiatica TaxID=4170 RepID=A0A5A7P496_STRAF|nr:leucine-rich repeat protein kinase family protein [Striga asiatica]